MAGTVLQKLHFTGYSRADGVVIGFAGRALSCTGAFAEQGRGRAAAATQRVCGTHAWRRKHNIK